MLWSLVISMRRNCTSCLVDSLLFLEGKTWEVDLVNGRPARGGSERSGTRGDRGGDNNGPRAGTGEVQGHIRIHSALSLTSIGVIGVIRPGESRREPRSGGSLIVLAANALAASDG